MNKTINAKYDNAIRNLRSTRNNSTTMIDNAMIQKNEIYPQACKSVFSGRSVNLHNAEPKETAIAIKANKNVKKLMMDLSIFIILQFWMQYMHDFKFRHFYYKLFINLLIG